MPSPTGDEDIYAQTRAVFSSKDPPEPMTTPEVAEALDLDRRTVYERLSTLADDGVLETKKVGSGGRVWWRPPASSDGEETDRLTASGSLADRIAEAIGEPVFQIDESGRVLAVNGAFTELLGYEGPTIRGESLADVLGEDAMAKIEPRLRELSTRKERTGSPLQLDVQTRGGSTIPVEMPFSVWTDDDGALLGAVGVLRDVRDRHERENKLARQQAHLGVLNNLHDVVRDVTTAVLEQSTREEIEAAVCDRLAASDSYSAALVAEVDPIDGELTPRLERGFDGYVDRMTISTDPDSPLGQGPASRAVRTREVQASQNVQDDPEFDPWRDAIEDYDFTSCVAIPIVHESTLYGLLGVFSTRKDAFADKERSVIGQLGETVGHAISAVERKQAMMSDEIVEIGLQCRRFFHTLGLEESFEGTAEFRRTVPVGDGSYLLYGTARNGGFEAVERLVQADSAPHYESVDVISEADERTHFEISLSDAPIPSVVSSNGGYVDEARLADGDLFVRVHLPPSANLHRLVDGVQECYPGIEPVTRRQKTRQKGTSEQFSTVLETTLTDRQLAALEAGYYAGFFEWPRDSSGEEVSEALDISPATFHQHVRTAEKKILDELFEEH